MAAKMRELCRRVRASDGQVTYHVVNSAGTLQQISENLYREFETTAVRTDCLYSKNDKQFSRAYKTVRFN